MSVLFHINVVLVLHFVNTSQLSGSQEISYVLSISCLMWCYSILFMESLSRNTVH